MGHSIYFIKSDNVNLKDTYTFLIFAMILKEFDVFLMKDVLSFIGR